jgi:exodeoxyribonuclease VII small subunit
MSEQDMTFEQAIESLERIVARLESGDVPLEEAIALFQDGMKLSHLCSDKLEQVERKIEMLVDSENGLNKKPFTTDEKGDLLG